MKNIILLLFYIVPVVVFSMTKKRKYNEDDIDTWNLSQLKGFCTERGIRKAGNKQELQQRVKQFKLDKLTSKDGKAALEAASHNEVEELEVEEEVGLVGEVLSKSEVKADVGTDESPTPKRGGKKVSYGTMDKRVILNQLKLVWNNPKKKAPSKKELFNRLCAQDSVLYLQLKKSRDTISPESIQKMVVNEIIPSVKSQQDELRNIDRKYPLPKEGASGGSGSIADQREAAMTARHEAIDEMKRRVFGKHFDVYEEIMDVFGPNATAAANGFMCQHESFSNPLGQYLARTQRGRTSQDTKDTSDADSAQKQLIKSKIETEKLKQLSLKAALASVAAPTKFKEAGIKLKRAVSSLAAPDSSEAQAAFRVWLCAVGVPPNEAILNPVLRLCGDLAVLDPNILHYTFESLQQDDLRSYGQEYKVSLGVMILLSKAAQAIPLEEECGAEEGQVEEIEGGEEKADYSD